MKKVAFILFAVALVVALMGYAEAFTVTLGSKQISVTIIITPSPTPIAYVPSRSSGIAVELPPVQRIDAMLAYDPYQLDDMVAQTNPQSSVKVQFTVKPDPTFAYFHLIPMNTTLNAGYGSNTFTCVYKVFASYSTSWTITDYTYGSNTSGGTAGLNGFPTFNYPTTSDIAWLAEGITTSFKAFANGGAPGETTFTGAAGTSKTVCIDLSVTVPSNISAGTYSATFNYVMSHT